MGACKRFDHRTCPHSPRPIIAHQGNREDGCGTRFGTTPIGIGEERRGVSNSFEERASRGDAIPLLTLVIEADDGDAAGHQKKVAGPRLLYVGDYFAALFLAAH